jgi:hypothetical protein
MDSIHEKTSEDLQREIDQDRERIGERIDAIQERMSPGQLVDEAIAYAKGSGGAEYLGNLGRALKDNPLPVALMGVSLAWLMAKSSSSSSSSAVSNPQQVQPEHPLYVANGPVRRLGPPAIENGQRYSHFSDAAGNRLKALTDERGHRAGHFMDEAGRSYRGFTDASGNAVTHIADETGRLLDAASGWAQERWQQAKEATAHLGATASSAAGSVSARAASTAGSVMDQTGRLNQVILTQFRDQPLVGGALAFAVGAAIGAALPHTEQEDNVLGEVSDGAKENLKSKAVDAVEHGKTVASEIYDHAAKAASASHETIISHMGDDTKAADGKLGDPAFDRGGAA